MAPAPVCFRDTGPVMSGGQGGTKLRCEDGTVTKVENESLVKDGRDCDAIERKCRLSRQPPGGQEYVWCGEGKWDSVEKHAEKNRTPKPAGRETKNG